MEAATRTTRTLSAFALVELIPDGFSGAADLDLDQEDDDRVELRSTLEVALPGRW